MLTGYLLRTSKWTEYINWIEISGKLPDSTIKHVYIFNSQEPYWCYSNCLRLVLGQNRALTLPKLCVICSRIIIKVQTFTEALCRNPRVAKSRQDFTPGNIQHYVWRGQWTPQWTTVTGETTIIVRSLCTGVNESLRFSLPCRRSRTGSCFLLVSASFFLSSSGNTSFWHILPDIWFWPNLVTVTGTLTTTHAQKMMGSEVMMGSLGSKRSFSPKRHQVLQNT